MGEDSPHENIIGVKPTSLCLRWENGLSACKLNRPWFLYCFAAHVSTQCNKVTEAKENGHVADADAETGTDNVHGCNNRLFKNLISRKGCLRASLVSENKGSLLPAVRNGTRKYSDGNW